MKKIVNKDKEIAFYTKKLNTINFADTVWILPSQILIKQLIEDESINHIEHIRCKANTFLKVLQNGFSNLHCEQLTSSYLYETFKDEEKYLSIHVLARFILVLDELNLLVNDDMKRVAASKDFLLNRLKKETFFKLLKDPVKEKFILTKTKDKNWYHLVLDVDDIELICAIKEFLKTTSFGQSHVIFFEQFAAGLKDKKQCTLYGLNFKTMIEQIHYIKQLNLSKCSLNNAIGLVDTFYYFIGTHYNPDIFKDAGLKVYNVRAVGFAKTILKGFDIINYNPIDVIPQSDKWMLVYANENVVNSDVNSTFTRLFDFTIVKNKTYRSWLKTYTWKTQNSIKTKSMKVSLLSDFLNYIDDLKTGKQISIYSKKSSSKTITINDVMAYKLHYTSTGKTSTSRVFNDIKNFLDFIDNTELGTIETGITYLLSSPERDATSNKNSIPDDELKRLANLMKVKADESDKAKLYYLIFYIALETEFRSSNVLTLKTTSIKETNKPGEYVLISPTKTSNKEFLEQPITTYTKRHIEEIVKITDKYRDESCPDEIKDYIFLCKNRTNSYHIITILDFNKHLQKCCIELNLPKYNFGNLRDTHMTKAEEFIVRNQLSDMQQNILSGHRTTETDHRYYTDTDIRTLLESVHGIIIGNVDVDGRIIDENDNVVSIENSVSNGCGYCSNSTCNDYSMLDCLMCKHFVTTISRLPYFEEAIKMIDHRIENAVIAHDKEDLVNIKRLYVGFINEILKRREEDGKNADI